MASNTAIYQLVDEIFEDLFCQKNDNLNGTPLQKNLLGNPKSVWNRRYDCSISLEIEDLDFCVIVSRISSDEIQISGDNCPRDNDVGMSLYIQIPEKKRLTNKDILFIREEIAITIFHELEHLIQDSFPEWVESPHYYLSVDTDLLGISDNMSKYLLGKREIPAHIRQFEPITDSVDQMIEKIKEMIFLDCPIEEAPIVWEIYHQWISKNLVKEIVFTAEDSSTFTMCDIFLLLHSQEYTEMLSLYYDSPDFSIRDLSLSRDYLTLAGFIQKFGNKWCLTQKGSEFLYEKYQIFPLMTISNLSSGEREVAPPEGWSK